jgi:serine/threonine-protein kinase
MLEHAEEGRERALAAVAAEDPTLAAEVRALLDADAAPASALASTLVATRPAEREPARPEPTREPAAAGRSIGPWRLEAELGRGGMGTVFRATDAAGRAAALKRLDAPHRGTEAAARFAREVRLGARVRHPYLLPVTDTLLDADGVPWLVMPLVDGETLRARLDRGGALPIAEAVRIGRSLADALAALHAARVAHRDLKPENVLLAPTSVADVPLAPDGAPTVERPLPLLTDFGIARALDAMAEARLTASGMLVGTPTYMSPEQLRAERGDDTATDVWALGVVLYECCAGAPPRRGPALRALLTGRPDAVPSLRERRPDVPPALDALVLAMLVPDRRARLAEAGAVRDALAALEATGGV